MIIKFSNGVHVSMIETMNPLVVELWPFIVRENSSRFYLWKSPRSVETWSLGDTFIRLSRYTNADQALELEHYE